MSLPFVGGRKELEKHFLRRYPKYKNHELCFVDCRYVDNPEDREIGKQHHGTHPDVIRSILEATEDDGETNKFNERVVKPVTDLPTESQVNPS